MNDIQQAALEYLKRGFSVIPLHGPNEPRNEPPDKRGKRPPIPWKEYQIKRPSEAAIQEWFDNGNYYNMGIVTGALSGITIVDFDTPEAVQLCQVS